MENKVILVIGVLLIFFAGIIFADSFTGNAVFDKFFGKRVIVVDRTSGSSVGEICDDKKDNDRDRRIDCQDPDCSRFCQLAKINEVRGEEIKKQDPKKLSVSKDSLVAYWSGDKTATDEVGKIRGQIKNVEFAKGKTGNAFSFLKYKSKGINLGKNSRLDIASGDFSVDVWLKWTEKTGNARTIFQVGEPVMKYALTTGAGDKGQGKAGFAVGKLDGNGIVSWYYDAGANLNDGKWHNVVAVKSGSKVKIYIDGKEARYKKGSIRLSSENIIGKGFYGSFVGSIDELKVYKKSLVLEAKKSTKIQGYAIFDRLFNAFGRKSKEEQRGLNFVEPVCGNRVVERGEECDGTYGCDKNCRGGNFKCGDGIRQPSEECDDGRQCSDGSPCIVDSYCERRVLPRESGGDTKCLPRGGDGCSVSCRSESVCGNGVVEGIEECDGTYGCEGCRLISTSFETCYTCGRDGCTSVTSDTATCAVLYSDSSCNSMCTIPDPDDGLPIDTVGTLTMPTPDDIALCESPDFSDLPEGTFGWWSGSSRHISQCETETTVRYVICGSDGSVTVSVNECSDKCLVREGFCIEELADLPTCYDSDGGFDLETQGRTELLEEASYAGRELERTDICIWGNPYIILEYYCDSNGDIRQFGLDCPFGTYCLEGACVPGVPEFSCEDTDGGLIADVFGEVAYVGPGFPAGLPPAEDFCSADIPFSVVEYSCTEEETVWSEVIACSDGEYCLEGACVPGVPEISCEDTDEGEDIYERGYVTQFVDDDRSLWTDNCGSWSIYYVEENWCGPDGLHKSEWKRCEEGEYCNNGACVDIGTCYCARTESDYLGGGAWEAGYVTSSLCSVHHDFCEGDILIKTGCNSEGMPAESERVDCTDSGEFCNNGVCIYEEVDLSSSES